MMDGKQEMMAGVLRRTPPMLQLLRKMLAREEMMTLLRIKEVETTSAGTAVRLVEAAVFLVKD